LGGEAGEATPDAPTGGPAPGLAVATPAAVGGGARAVAIRELEVHLAQGSLPQMGSTGFSSAAAWAAGPPVPPDGSAGGGCCGAGAGEAPVASLTPGVCELPLAPPPAGGGGAGGRRGRLAAAPPAQGSAVKNGSGEEPEGVVLAGPGWEASPIRTPR
jgi:hypothetical protein